MKRIWWTVIIFYIGLIYATLGFAPAIWEAINSFLGGRGLLMQYIVYSAISALVFLYIVFIKRERSLLKYLSFFLCIGLFLAMVKLSAYPAEKIHIAQYGILGVLLYNALKIDFDKFAKKLYVIGAAICLVSGALDEVIQWLLPNRYFDLIDLFINGASGIIALFLIRNNILRRENQS